MIIHALRRTYWWLVRPTSRGVRAVILDDSGRVFLVKHTYQDGWFLPGGKADTHESDPEALERELREEVGLTQPYSSTLLGRYTNSFEFKKDFIAVFVVRAPVLDGRKHFEIDAANYFPLDALPPRTSPGTRRRIAEATQGVAVTESW